ncbi:hypothetical protein ELUMI_v1c05320 [Williamsoniiplasma luminosum]|uniref:Uncharacterized protein n=1 Tax=Williamsoniiplasma luminosum TaxID=214888 RepID=A0A2K8NUN7_9MOLU|nr:hypothetical protein [Williamsoniiplasma luminosum]ATZ17256.1 hypothetical protein ELUMI_v1c05320 [Williamsoniiplasma luminosum]
MWNSLINNNIGLAKELRAERKEIKKWLTKNDTPTLWYSGGKEHRAQIIAMEKLYEEKGKELQKLNQEITDENKESN